MPKCQCAELRFNSRGKRNKKRLYSAWIWYADCRCKRNLVRHHQTQQFHFQRPDGTFMEPHCRRWTLADSQNLYRNLQFSDRFCRTSAAKSAEGQPPARQHPWIWSQNKKPLPAAGNTRHPAHILQYGRIRRIRKSLRHHFPNRQPTFPGHKFVSDWKDCPQDKTLQQPLRREKHSFTSDELSLSPRQDENFPSFLSRPEETSLHFALSEPKPEKFEETSIRPETGSSPADEKD